MVVLILPEELADVSEFLVRDFVEEDKTLNPIRNNAIAKNTSPANRLKKERIVPKNTKIRIPRSNPSRAGNSRGNINR